MTRRWMVWLLLLFPWLASCRRKEIVRMKRAPIVTKQDVLALLSSRIAIKGQGIEFDPTLLLALAGLLMNLLRLCLMNQIRRQQRAVQCRPDGVIAGKLRSMITEEFRRDHPEADAAAVSAHVDQAVVEFGRASDEELTSLIQQVRSLPDGDLQGDFWRLDWVVNELNETTEEGE